LTKRQRLKLRVWMRNSVSTSTDHSTLSHNSHSTELLNATVPTTSGWRDGETTSELNNGTSMKSQRLSRTTTGNHTHLTSNPMEDQATSDAPLLIQDGGNFSRLMEHMWKILETQKCLQSQEELTMKTGT
jgi:hypothetical protein